jgi:hypothetical protein
MENIKTVTRVKAAAGITIGVIAGIAVGFWLTSIMWGVIVAFVGALTLSTLFSFKKDTPARKGSSTNTLRPPL